MASEEQTRKAAEEVIHLIGEKNRDYRNTYASLDIRGLFVGYNRKVMRLKAMVWERDETDQDHDKVREEVRDLAALGLLGLVLLDSPAHSHRKVFVTLKEDVQRKRRRGKSLY